MRAREFGSNPWTTFSSQLPTRRGRSRSQRRCDHDRVQVFATDDWSVDNEKLVIYETSTVGASSKTQPDGEWFSVKEKSSCGNAVPAAQSASHPWTLHYVGGMRHKSLLSPL